MKGHGGFRAHKGRGLFFVVTERVAGKGMEGEETKSTGHPRSWRLTRAEWEATLRVRTFTSKRVKIVQEAGGATPNWEITLKFFALDV